MLIKDVFFDKETNFYQTEMFLNFKDLCFVAWR